MYDFMKDEDRKLGEEVYYDQNASEMKPLSIGSPCRLQDPKSGLWNKTVKILEARNGGRSYKVQCATTNFVRNRKYLKPFEDTETRQRECDNPPPSDVDRHTATFQGVLSTRELLDVSEVELCIEKDGEFYSSFLDANGTVSFT
eukprot:maker-scaffold1317_size48620-snap-gene-0.6 protein:Tk08573 transcript:maker-scaffold1317_size48620-snap-gene-0.6-mRNA-1 annotation:"hypothetical protein DAPPUDRAFT_116586"